MVLATDISDDDDVWLPGQILCGKSLEHGDKCGGKLGRHGRVDVLVGATDLVPRTFEELGDGTHSCATNPNEVYFHARASTSFRRAAV